MYGIKETNDIFNDILLSSLERPNKMFFYQIIGVPDNKDELLNNIYLLDRKLSNLDLKVYHKYINDIPMNDTRNITETIRNSFKFKDITQKDFIFKKSIETTNISQYVSHETFKEIAKIFIMICNEWYNETSKKKNITFDMLVSFSVKQASWLNDIFPKIFNGILNLDEIVSKVIFYGNITAHEFIFLKLLFNIGCDILYINTKKQPEFLSGYGQTKLYEKFCEIPDFPKEEKIVSYETNALRAQNEVSESYYDNNSIQPWSLQKHIVKVVPLKTTYNEMFELWKLESNMRPGFKVIDNTVYIPTLCCKINGVPENKKEYINKIKDLDENENVLIFENKIVKCNSYNGVEDKYEYVKNFTNKFSNTQQLTDVEKIKQSVFFHEYKHLDLDIQNAIIQIHKSFVLDFKNSKIQKDEMNKNLAVLYSLDNDVLELLQKYDYGTKVPKIILFHNDNSTIRNWDNVIFKIFRMLAFDIVAITPTRYCNIENAFNNDILNVFNIGIGEMDIKNPFKNSIGQKQSFLERIFGYE